MQYIFTMDTSTVSKLLNFFASWCLIFSSLMVRFTSSFPTTNYPLPLPSGTAFGIQEDDLIAESHIMLKEYVGTLKERHNHVFDQYKQSRFTSNDASCSGSFTVNGLPPHHRLEETYDIEEDDLLMTHHHFVGQYIRMMKAAIDDELQYEKPDNFVVDRDPQTDSFLTVKNWLERVQSTLAQQIHLEGFGNTGIVLFSIQEDFHFAPHSDESFRNIRVLCVLEDLYEYLPRLLADTIIAMRAHS